MIAYTEKGAGLHDAIRAAGHALRRENGVWIADDEAAVQALIDGYALADCAAARATEVDAYAARLRTMASKNSTPSEMASWALKKAEADRFAQSAAATDAPNLALEAATRGVSLAVLAAKVQAKAVVVARVEAKIAGAAGKHKDALKTMTDFASLLAYDFSAGWPAV